MQCRFISDLHLYDVSSINWRPNFSSLDTYAMNLIDCWNAFTQPEDLVFIVGDVGHFCPRTIQVLKKLYGTKVLIVGNHDIEWGTNLYTCGVFSGIHQQIYANNIYINHTPDGDRGNCVFYVHGHHHRYDMHGMSNVLKDYARDTCRINCSADLINNKPCTLQELILCKEVWVDKYRELGLL